MANLADTLAQEIVLTLSADTKRNAVRAGDPHLLAELHLCLARIEAKHGSLDNAIHQMEMAGSLLAKEPNVWLQGVYHIDLSVIYHLASKPDVALTHSRSALQFASASGHARSKKAAFANLGLLSFYGGDLDSAEFYLDQGIRTEPRIPDIEAALLDSYAQLKLVADDCGACEALLDEACRKLQRHDGGRPSWYEMVAYQTRIRLLHRKGEWTKAAALAARAVLLAAERADRLLAALFRILEADALIALEQLDEAATVLAEAAEAAAGAPLATLAQLERVRGKLLARQLDRSADIHFGRALRILTVTGDACSHRETEADYEAMAGGPSSRGAAGMPDPVARGDPASRFTPDLEIASILLDLAPNAELLGREAVELIRRERLAPNAAVLARNRQGSLEALATVGWTRDEACAMHGSPPAVATLDLGAFRDRTIALVVGSPPDLPSRIRLALLRRLLENAVELHRLRQAQKQRDSLWPVETLPHAQQGVFVSEVMVGMLRTAGKIAPTDLAVLLTGETGTGKELFAQIIHRQSNRRDKPFIPFNCKAVPRDMLDSQLFGHRRGAFTGAQETFPGVIRAAAEGTVFLDEIGEIDLDLQPKLLRFLDTGEIHPLGELRPVRVPVRVIAATNADLERLVSEGRFREDLYYRLNVIRLRIPPLRERREEIPPLVHHFLHRFAEEMDKGHLRVSDEAMEYLLLYGWPGNVRQLANVLRSMVAFAERDGFLTAEHLTDDVRRSRRTVPAAQRPPTSSEVLIRTDQPLAAAVDTLERALVNRALEAANGRFEQAARILGITRKGLFLKRRRWGLHESHEDGTGEAGSND
jgi:DNA-binding NtrC family response regulator/tetratricopeptide (TPR) repeat protein